MMEDALSLDRAALDRARLSRDPRFDGRFFIAVTSPGSTAGRSALATSNPANVRYFIRRRRAEAGFRPARCRPEAPGSPAWQGVRGRAPGAAPDPGRPAGRISVTRSRGGWASGRATSIACSATRGRRRSRSR
jgi:hypothetical protein